MKQVVVFRHACCEGAGYLGTFLARHAIPWCEVRIDKGEAVPTSVDDYSGIVLMGGPMSVNDDLPWIPPLLQLIRQAVDKDVPLLGHCLGGQLISKALGGVVSKNPVKEIGWGQVQVADHAAARDWFGDLQGFNSFHWHGETFTVPAGATHVLSSPYCANQAYVMGKHIGLQCHIEMTPEMVKVWTEQWKNDIASAAASPAVQSADTMLAEVAEDCDVLHQVADKVYSRWIQGLA
ncbi:MULTISPECIES: type 1 glutamine amidotransferase [unclassified Methylophilus]|uniref:type 1 glutamine amidotransferase n=1 Tax=unclassified Methylophilus TaxID=2630143 RepID=UPI00188E6B91|nr:MULTISPECIES: type 1 glutamine amidotransferase [unclassified Methylophilus]MBF4989329.1 type 1 glutamine amidotransferase [Methylophilus sp. 14]MBF4991396.1 type 1 glutamine amidotransferase [Methylophilus sp. QUAN]